jgi:hypothetical protein
MKRQQDLFVSRCGLKAQPRSFLTVRGCQSRGESCYWGAQHTIAILRHFWCFSFTSTTLSSRRGVTLISSPASSYRYYPSLKGSTCDSAAFASATSAYPCSSSLLLLASHSGAARTIIPLPTSATSSDALAHTSDFRSWTWTSSITLRTRQLIPQITPHLLITSYPSTCTRFSSTSTTFTTMMVRPGSRNTSQHAKAAFLCTPAGNTYSGRTRTQPIGYASTILRRGTRSTTLQRCISPTYGTTIPSKGPTSSATFYCITTVASTSM